MELGESLQEGVARELSEETGLDVRVLELIEVFDRIFSDEIAKTTEQGRRPRFHFVIVDYLCERIGGEARAGSDVTDVAFASEDELAQYHLTETATRVLKKAFAMARARGSGALIHASIYLRPGAEATPIRSLSRSLCDFNASVRIGELQLATSRSDRPV